MSEPFMSRRELSAPLVVAAVLAVFLLGGWRWAGAHPPAPVSKPVPAAEAVDPEVLTPADVARREAVLRIVDELRGEASRIRGLPWRTPVPAQVIGRARLRANFEKMIKEEMQPEEYARELRQARRLGILRADEDPIQIELGFMERGVAGYYDPKAKRFFVIDGLSGEAQRPTILHELIHALEDQYIDLESRQRAFEKDPDGGFALKVVIEGSAEHARLLYQRANPEIAKLAMKEQASSKDMTELRTTLAKTPASLVVPTLLHYQVGPAFVGRAVGKGDYRAVMERLYADAPTTQEQSLHPGKFLSGARDLPRSMPWPKGLAEAAGPGWKGLESSPVGELDFALWMDRWLGATDGHVDMNVLGAGRFYVKDAQKAAEGWDGMWLEVFDHDGKATGVVMASAWDTPADAMEAANAIRKALGVQHKARYEGGEWKTGADGHSTVDFKTPYGLGRLEVIGDEVRLVDGFPQGSLDRVWALLAAMKMTRDAADTWTPASEPDPFAGSHWRDDKLGVAWKAPDDTWKAEADGTSTKLKKGELTVRLTTVPGTLQQNMLKLLVEAKNRYPRADLDPQKFEEATVGTKEAAKLPLDDRSAAEGQVEQGRSIVIATLGDGLLLIEASAPKASWQAAQADLTGALEAFLFKD